MFVTESENIYDILNKFTVVIKENMFDWITNDKSAPAVHDFKVMSANDS